MSKKTKWEERIGDLLGEFGLTRAEALKGHIKFDDKVGTINILDEVQPRMITVKNVDDAKRFAGVPDEDYHDALSKHFDIPAPWPEEKNHLAPADLEPKQKQDIKRAMISYVYGNSEKVKSYKDIINKVHFPMTVPLITGDTLIVYTSQTYPLDKNLVFDTIMVYKGGKINCQGNITVKAKSFVQSNEERYPPQAAKSFAVGDTSGEGSFYSVGADGPNGTPGGNGAAGGKGSKGSNATDGKHCTSAGNGGVGGNGTDGTTGGNGGDGQDGNCVTGDMGAITGTIILLSSGGDGGKGGTGGIGGDGGMGGDPGDTTTSCPNKASQGQGGNGGKGGKGGNGGNGGNGNALVFRYDASKSTGTCKLGTPKGLAGPGGAAGNPGAAGKGNPDGEGGKAGDVGQNGTRGKVGTVTVNGKPLG